MSFRPLKWVDNAPPRAQPVSTADWNRHRDHITQLHYDGKTRKEISQIMARDFDFKPSAHQYTSQFEKWNLRRYNTAKESTQPLASESGADVPPTQEATNQPELHSNTHDFDALFHRQDVTSNLQVHEAVLGCQNPFSDPHEPETILDRQVPIANAKNSTIMTPATASASQFADPTREAPGDGDLQFEAEELPTAGNETPRVSPQATGGSLSEPTDMDISYGHLESHSETMVVSGGSGACTRSNHTANPFDSASETSSIRTVAGPSNAPRPNIPFNRVYNSHENPFSLRIEVERFFTSGLWDARANGSIGNLSESMSMLSVDERGISPSITSQTGLRQVERERIMDEASDWMSFETRSLSPMQTDRMSALVVSSENVNTPELLRERYSSRQLRNIRRLLAKHKISDEDIKAVLQSADFLRVSLLFEDALDMYLLVYLFLADADYPFFDHFLLLQAITGCVESTRTISGVKLVKDILLRASGDYSSSSFLEATGYPLPYLFGHIAMLENKNDSAVRHFRQAVQELGTFRFRDSAAVTSVLVHQLVTKLETLNARRDPNFGRFNSDLDWLNIANWELRNTDSPSTLPAAVKALLTWCISTMDDERLDATIEDCFLLSEEAFAVDKDGTNNSLHATLIMCAHFWTMWGCENLPGSQSNVSLQVQPSIELISQELEVDLLAIFAAVARMIMEQLTDALPVIEDTPGESNLVTHMRNNTLRLANLEPVDLEKSFIKTYFFVNTKAPNFGEGLHPRRYIRAIAVQSMPEAILRGRVGPSWMVDTPSRSNVSITSTSTRCGAAPLQLLYRPSTMHSSPRSSLSGLATMRALRDALKRRASMRSGRSDTSYIPSKAMRQKSIDSFRRLMGPSLTSVNVHHSGSSAAANRPSMDVADGIN